MKANQDIQNKVDDTFSAIDAIDTVKVSPFFKQKTLQRLFAKKEDTPLIWAWFTPQVQLATFVGILILNVLAFTKLGETAYHENISQFAKSYELSSGPESVLNLP